MHDCSAQLADAELPAAHCENRREDVHRMRVRWRWRAYLGLNGVPEPEALLLPVVQGHVPVPAQNGRVNPNWLRSSPLVFTTGGTCPGRLRRYCVIGSAAP